MNTANEWKIQINKGVNFISSKDTEEIRTFYVHSDIEEIRSGNEKVEIITKLIKSFPSNYQKEEKILKKKEVSLYLKALNYYLIIFIK